MGTRHITAVVSEGQFVVAQYGQWDGYPTGQEMTLWLLLVARLTN